ncbi:transcriptional regulator with XRE-family HTH domain [Lipingzhangella halophila]|uniref:Transcriptional regulator with XRE-family HTH domain n=1 Tax=Lipingzhangella halophila TaxID=1783352 RepID=A0A7W7RPB1_9ACTN|nr:helix-turn-helix transcriptional regulator [Lipingzhangella halophila]MBB4935694.1 transcriptional regulator with XRE-family HTH domain [Lipingzhangella halophila]
MINRHALTALRIKDGQTKARLAQAAGISPQYYGEIENGRRLCERRPDIVKAIATALDVPTSAITCTHHTREEQGVPA